MTSMYRFKKHKIASLFLILLLLAVLVFIYKVNKVNSSVQSETKELQNQAAILQLPPEQRHVEKNIGCTWAERQDWDLEGCYIGLQNVYDERGSGNTLEQQITEALIKNGWQKRQAEFVKDSQAVEIYSSEASFTKQTATGNFCSGYSHRYFSNDIQNGHRALYFYILGPSDKGCSRW